MLTTGKSKVASLIPFGNGSSPNRNGAHPPPQVAGLGGVPSRALWLGHRGEFQQAEIVSLRPSVRVRFFVASAKLRVGVKSG